MIKCSKIYRKIWKHSVDHSLNSVSYHQQTWQPILQSYYFPTQIKEHPPLPHGTEIREGNHSMGVTDIIMWPLESVIGYQHPSTPINNNNKDQFWHGWHSQELTSVTRRRHALHTNAFALTQKVPPCKRWDSGPVLEPLELTVNIWLHWRRWHHSGKQLQVEGCKLR